MTVVRRKSPNSHKHVAKHVAVGRRSGGGGAGAKDRSKLRSPEGQRVPVPAVVKKQPDATGAGLDPVPLAERQLGDEFPVLKAGAPRSAETGAIESRELT